MIAHAKEKPGTGLARILLVPFGSWQGHSNGVQTYGPAECAAMVDYFQRTVAANGHSLVIDYEHQTVDGETRTGPIPAAGWIWSVELDEKGDPPGIYGMVEWTPTAAQAIRNKEYKYLSPVIAAGHKDPVTGQPVPIQLWNAALTNTPFMADRMPPVSANADAAVTLYMNTIRLTQYNTFTDQGGPTVDPQKMMDDVKAALKLDAGASPEDVLSFLKKLVEFIALAPGAPADGAPTPDALPGMETEMKQAVANAAELKKVADLLGVEPGKVLENVAKTTANSTKPDEVAALRDSLAEMQAKAFITEHANRIPPAKIPFWTKLAKEDMARATELVAEMPVILNNDHPKTSTDAKTDEVTDDDTNAIRTMLNTHKFYQKKEA